MENSILIFGGGDLQISIIKKAKTLGYKTIVWDPKSNAPGKNYCDKFYDIALNTYNTFVKEDIDKNYINKIETTENNIFSKKEDIIIKPSFSIEQVNNIQLESAGTQYMFGSGDPKRSYREAMQTQNVFNTKTNKWENWTPNDDDKRGLFDFNFKDPLVEAR